MKKNYKTHQKIKIARTLLFGMLFFMGFSANLFAANIVVTDNSGSPTKPGSLKKALDDAADGDTITFNLPAGSETILFLDYYIITKNVTIDGSNTAGSGVPVTIEQNEQDQYFANIFQIQSAITVTISNLTFNGNSQTFSGSNDGGIIFMNNGSLNLESVVFKEGNAEVGGAIHATIAAVNVTINNCTFEGNTAQIGGAIYSGVGNMTITNSLFTGNSATTGSFGYGGAIFATSNGTNSISNSTFFNNTATDYGGAIMIDSTANLTLESVTIVGNSANTSAGGIYCTDKLTIKNCILANNSNFDYFGYTSAVLTDNGYNIVETQSGPSLFTAGTNIIGDQVNLFGTGLATQTLVDNGGLTKTLAIEAGSVAIGVGSTALTTDQRGLARATPTSIGAFHKSSQITPGGVAGANLWLKANDGATNSGSNLTGWTDKTGTNTFSVLGGTPPTLNQNVVNFQPIVRFNNFGDKGNNPYGYLDGNTSITYVDGFAVYLATAANANPIGGTSPGPAYGVALFAKFGSGSSYVSNGFLNSYQSFTNSNIDTHFNVVNMDVSPTVSPFSSARLNGLDQTVTTSSGADYSNITFTPRIGATNNNGSDTIDGWPYFVGDLAEVVLYPSSLSTGDKGKIESYLAIKYGIQLAGNYVSSSGVTIWNATANSTYHNDVFGLGKDDGSELNQTASNSINTGSGNGTGQSGKGNIVLSNPASLADGDFLLIGHDNGALAEQTADVPLNKDYTRRIGREWKVKHTNNVGTVKLIFDISSLVFTHTAVASNFILLVDADGNGNFKNGTVHEFAAASLSANALEFQNVTLNDGAVFTIVTDNGYGPTTWDGTSWSYGVPNQYKDAVVAGDLSLTSNLETKTLILTGARTLTVNPNYSLTVHGILSLANDSSLLFKSDATGSGMFGPFSGVESGGGTVTVERYIPARRSFRFLTSAVTTTTTINANWQQAGVNNPGLGTHITGTGGATNGFDVSGTDNPSMFTFNGGTQIWDAVTNTNANTLTAGDAYRLMVRGDRTVDLLTNTPAPTNTVLRATGKLKTGNYSPTLATGANEFSLVGNPYQAPIDIKAVLAASTNMNSGVVYYWDPTLNTRGGYVTRDLNANTNDVSSNFNQYLQPGQAVFVKKDATANAPSMTITESNKSLANAAAGVFRMAKTTTPLLRYELNSSQVSNAVLDGGLILFDSAYTWNATAEDHTKFSNLDEQVGVKLQNQTLAIAKQSIPNEADELPLEVLKYRNTNYNWKFSLQDYTGPTPYLYDNLNQTYTEIVDNGAYTFSVDAQNTVTTDSSRFKIVFTNKTLKTEKFELNSIVLYPNPLTKGKAQEFILKGISENARVAMYNTLGQKMPITIEKTGADCKVKSTTQLSSGIYFVKVDQDTTTSRIKLIVE